MQAFSSLASSKVSDLWSTSHSTPFPDKVDSLTGKQITEDKTRGTQTFKFSRKLDTGDSTQDFLVPVGSGFTMCYGINYKQANFAQHQDYSSFPLYLTPEGKVLFTLNPADSTGPIVPATLTQAVTHKDYLTHGIVLYIAWFGFGFLLLLSKRYVAAPHFGMQIMHSLSGYAILILTVVMSLLMIKKYGWKIKNDLHTILGVIVLAAVFIAVLSGMARMSLGKSEPARWVPKDNAMRVGKVHKFVGFAILLLANVTCLTGVISYTRGILQNDKATPILVITLPLFAVLFLIFEINRRVANKINGLKFDSKKIYPTFTMEQVSAMLAEKRELVLIDNLVLDTHEYGDFHPGGKTSAETSQSFSTAATPWSMDQALRGLTSIAIKR